MAEQEILHCNVLITKEEYTAFFLQQQQSVTKSTDRVLITVGLIGLFLGALGSFFGKQVGLPTSLIGGVLAGGVLCLLFCTVVRPMTVRAKAMRIYEDQPEIRQTAAYVFTEDAVQVRTSRQNGTVSLKNLTAWIQEDRFLVLYFGRELTILLPTRVMMDPQIRQLTDKLKSL